MNWKSTLALVILAAGAGLWLWKGDAVAPRLAPKAAPPDSPALAALEADFTPVAITRVEVAPPGGDAFVFEKGEKGWAQPGNWPLRAAEVNELVEMLGTLRTRFQPVPLPENPDLASYGLADAQKPVVVKVKAGGKDYALKFGEPELKPGEAPFTRPAYVRVGDAGEVLKLGPDVMPVLRRPADSYRRRQLFSDVERVKLAGAVPPFPQPGMPPDAAPTTVTLPGPSVEAVRVSAKSPKVFGFTPWTASGAFTLKRVGPTPAQSVTSKNAESAVQPDRFADAWAVEAPVRAQPEPAALHRVLAAVPDLWVEDFIPAAQPAHAQQPFVIAQLLPVPLEPFAVTAARLHPEAVKDPRAELKESRQSVSVTTQGGSTVTVKFGGVAKVSEREEPITLPGAPGMPPRTIQRKVQTTYRYAQIEGNPQLFTVPADKLDALFAKAGELVDSRVARFVADDVWRVTVERPGQTPVILERKKGNPKAAKDEEKRDRWLIEQQPNPLPADSGRVEEFVDRLAGFRADADSDLYFTDPKARGLDPAKCVVVTVTAREKRPEGEPDAPAREYKLLVGAADLAAGKLPIQLAGWPRITLVNDRLGGADQTGWLTSKLFAERLEPLFKRDAVAYRSRKLIDTADAKLTGLTVEGATPFALKREKKPDGGDAWKLTAPLASDADPQNAQALVAQFDNLQATEFVAEKPANLAEYGLDKPRMTVTLAFDNNRTYRLEVGAPRPGKKDEVFARLDGGAVFAVANPATERLAAGPVGLLPLKVWSVPVDRLTAAEVTRPDKPEESFALAKDGTNWKLTGPFTAPVSFLDAQLMLTQLGNLTAVKYETLAASDPAKFGFDKPLGKVKLTYSEKTSDGERSVAKTLVIGGVTPGAFDHYAKLDEPNAAVFVLPGVYLFAAQTPPLSLLDRNLLFLDSAKIAKVQISGDKPENAITLVKDDKGAWKAEGAAFTVDALVARQVADTFSPLPVARLAAYGDAVKWGDFGLEKPEYTVTVTFGREPETHTVLLGKPDPTGGRFVRVDGGKAVGVIPPEAVKSLARAKLDFADRTLLTFKPDELMGLSRAKGKDEFELAPGAGDGWDVVKPAKLKADKLLVEELADALGRLRAERIAAFGKKEEVYKQFGLEPAEATVMLTIGEKLDKKVLRLGRSVDAAKPDGDRFVAVEGTGAEAAVAVLPGALANKLLAPPVSFRDRGLARFVDADQLVLERPGRAVTFTKVAGTWKVTKPLATEAEQAALDDLVNDLAKLRAADWVSEKPTPEELKNFGLENPEAVWTVKNGDKVELVLRVGKKTPDGRAYATVGTGGMVALLAPAQTAKVLAEYRTRKPWTLDAFQATQIEINRGGKPFVLKKSGMTWSDPAAPADAIDPRPVAELLGALTALQVERFAVDADADLKLFGLEKPEATITVTLMDGATRVLAVGGVVGGTGDKQRYARVVDKGRTDVFVLSAADTERFMRDRGVYVQKK
jgi:hypothetical protein